MTKVSVQWNGKKFDPECDTTKPVSEFMIILEKLTGVPVANQQLMMRGKRLKPQDTWPAIKAGTRFMLIGTAEIAPVPLEPAEHPAEEEEEIEEGKLSRKEYANVVIGLPNLGNTCYLNACLQTLRHLPKLARALCDAEIGPGNEHAVTRSLSTLFKKFPQGLNTVIAALKASNRELFDAKTEEGIPKQQDAAEAWMYIMQQFSRTLGAPVSNLFEIGYEVTKTSLETGDTETLEVYDSRLPIDINEEVRQIEQGIIMDTELEKTVGGRITLWREHRAISKLPPYLVCQMMRFTYKKEEQCTAKIMRRVNHPNRIDMLPYLAPALRTEIVEERENKKGNPNGFYKLKAVLTHRGRSSDSGHYITHVKVGDQWFRFDDQKVTEVEDEAIDMLAGSADWHSSVLLIYEAE